MQTIPHLSKVLVFVFSNKSLFSRLINTDIYNGQFRLPRWKAHIREFITKSSSKIALHQLRSSLSSLSASTSQNSPDVDSDADIIEVNAGWKEPKVKSRKEAMTMLEDVIEYLSYQWKPNRNGNWPLKVLPNIQCTWFHRKITEVSVQSSHGLFQLIPLSCFKNNTLKDNFSLRLW